MFVLVAANGCAKPSVPFVLKNKNRLSALDPGPWVFSSAGKPSLFPNAKAESQKPVFSPPSPAPSGIYIFSKKRIYIYPIPHQASLSPESHGRFGKSAEQQKRDLLFYRGRSAVQNRPNLHAKGGQRRKNRIRRLKMRFG